MVPEVAGQPRTPWPLATAPELDASLPPSPPQTSGAAAIVAVDASSPRRSAIRAVTIRSLIHDAHAKAVVLTPSLLANAHAALA